MTRRVWLAAAVVMLMLGAAGCGRNQAPVAEPRPPVWVEPTCPKPDANQGMVTPPGMSETRGSIPDGFVAAWVLRCGFAPVTERADTEVAELVDLLRRPSDPRSNGTCPAHYVQRPYVALVNAENKAILPDIPTDGCGQPRQEVLDFIQAMPFRTQTG